MNADTGRPCPARPAHREAGRSALLWYVVTVGLYYLMICVFIGAVAVIGIQQWVNSLQAGLP